jgi:hypothetical protein
MSAFAADAVGQRAGDELPDAPDRRVRRGEHADLADRQPGVGGQQREHAPGEAVVEVVDHARLAGCQRCLVPERGERGDLARGQLPVQFGSRSDVA